MRKFVIGAFFALCLLIPVSLSIAQQTQGKIPSPAKPLPSAKAPADVTVNLHNCTDDKLGVKFLCNPDWELETDKDTMLIVISDEPAVTMTVAKSHSPVIFLDQLTHKAIQEMGQYADGFSTEQVKVAGRDAIKVKGLAQEYQDIQLVDYYLIYDFNLYSVLFSVEPKARLAAYEPLINKIVNSLSFLKPANDGVAPAKTKGK